MDSQEQESVFDRPPADLQMPVIQQQQTLYSAKLLEQAGRPRNVGRMDSPDAQATVLGWCGDTMEIYLTLEQDRIRGDTMEIYLGLEQIRIRGATFMTDGCGPSLACGSMLTTLIQGMTLEQANQFSAADLRAALDGMPEESAHCADLAVNTLHKAIAASHHSGPPIP
jgi:nitrogen fixation NifU-like protein